MRHPMIVGWFLLLFGIATLLARPAEPEFVPPGAIEVLPDSFPEMWEYEYRQAALCAGIANADPYRVRWYLVPTDYTGMKVPGKPSSVAPNRGYNDVGVWTRPHNIYIPMLYRNFEWVIRHEALHDLLGQKVHRGRLLELLHTCKATWGYLE